MEFDPAWSRVLDCKRERERASERERKREGERERKSERERKQELTLPEDFLHRGSPNPENPQTPWTPKY